VNAAAAAQRAMAAALRDPHRPVPPGLRAWNGSDPGRRLDVHRNNVVAAWVGALADTFPVVRHLVGPDFFARMARDFARAHPPRSPVLAEWGDGMAGYLETYAPAAGLRYLPDMARLERACLRAAQAADRAPCDPAALAALLAQPQRLQRLRLVLHPSLALLRSRHAVASLWAAHQGTGPDEAALAGIDPDTPENALVLRNPADELLVLALDDDAARAVATLAAGGTLGRAARGLAPPVLAAVLGRLLAAGAVVGWQADVPENPPTEAP
jgi:hypothetical protein